MKAKKPTKKVTKRVLEKVKNIKKKEVKCIKPEENAIFNLSDDCFIEIFRYMNVHDLVNLVKSSPKFQPNASKAFGIKYRHKPLRISRISIQSVRRFEMHLDHVGLKGVYSLPQLKWFFRNFGAAISNVEIENGHFESNVINILKLICGHSAKTLTCLRFHRIKFTSKILSYLRLLRPTLNQLNLNDCNLYELPNLFRNFTNLAVLGLNRSSIDPKIIEHSFPNLRELKIYNSRRLKNENLIEFIRLNPQLTVFDIRYCQFITHDIFGTIGVHLAMLSTLHIHYNRKRYAGTYQQFPLNIYNLQTLSLVGFVHLDTYLNEMAPHNVRLNSIEIHDLDDENQTKNIIDCIGQYKHITRLVFVQSRITSKHVQQISRKVPQLMELILHSSSVDIRFDLNALVGLTDNCKQLSVLKLETGGTKTLLFDCQTSEANRTINKKSFYLQPQQHQHQSACRSSRFLSKFIEN